MQLTGESIVQLGFWLTWLIVPLVYELVPTVWGLVRLLFMKRSPMKEPQVLPQVSLIIPTYNSADTLYQCLQSVAASSYPQELISILIADNQSTDDTFIVFQQAQVAFPHLRIQWLNTGRGKAVALNSAIYNTNGRYIINIDSDGVLEQNAILNLVKQFENDPTIDALTGTVLTQYQQISQQKSLWRRLLQVDEYFEYVQDFLTGRTVESASNQLFTMSGAFSAFRREKLLRTRLYNTNTVGEDIEMTFQIRQVLKGHVAACHSAVFYVEPIASFDALYTQRQRWQRGEFHTVRKFIQGNAGITGIFRSFVIRRLIIDHTILFLRMIWLFAFFILIPFGYSLHLVGTSFFLLYLLYVGIAFLNFISAGYYLKPFPDDHHYYFSRWWVTLTLPLFFFLTSLIQMVGVVNAMTQPERWKGKSYHEETRTIKKIIYQDLKEVIRKDEK